MMKSTIGPSAAEPSSSNEEGISSTFINCPPVEKKKTAGGKFKHN